MNSRHYQSSLDTSRLPPQYCIGLRPVIGHYQQFIGHQSRQNNNVITHHITIEAGIAATPSSIVTRQYHYVHINSRHYRRIRYFYHITTEMGRLRMSFTAFTGCPPEASLSNNNTI